MIAPMLLEQDHSNDERTTNNENSESYVQLYIMVINVVKSVLLLVASLGPRTTFALVTSTIITSFVMGSITILWFHFSKPQKYVDIQPASIPFINVFKASSYFASVITAIVVIVAQSVGEKKFSTDDIAIALAFAWIAVIASSSYYFYSWKYSNDEFLADEEKLIDFPFEYRDCENQDIIEIFHTMRGKSVPTFVVSAWYDDTCSQHIREMPVITNPVAYHSSYTDVDKNVHIKETNSSDLTLA